MKRGLSGWVEVFKTGRHTDSKGKTRNFTAADLDRMVRGYDPDVHEAPAVIGHPKDNAPAWGWVEALKRSGDVLLAKFRQVQSEFEEMVRQGLYKKRSISIYPDGTLRHVGFLGAQPPALKGLANVDFKDVENPIIYEFQEFKEDQGMEIDELKRKLADAEQARKDAEEKAKLSQARADQAATDMAESKRKARLAEIHGIIDSGIKEGKILPAWKKQGLAEFMTALDEMDGEYEFSEGRKQSPAAWFQEWVASFASHPLFKEFAAEVNQGQDGEEGYDPDLTGKV